MKTHSWGRLCHVPLLMVLLFTGAVAAENEPLYFTDTELQSRYDHLLSELRCLVCQNQSLIDSDAPLANDLRLQVYNMLAQGDSDEEIIHFLVLRYGDFVLYRPPVRPSTWLLWYAPVLMLLIAIVIFIRVWHRDSMKEGTK